MSSSISPAASSAIRKVIAGVFRIPLEQVSPDMSIDTTEGWDSLKHVEVVVALEEQLGVMLEGDEIAEMRSVAEIERILGDRLPAQS